MDTLFTCPECGADKVVVYGKTAYMANGLDLFCHSVKAHDINAEAACLECEWHGTRDQLAVKSECKAGE